MNIADYYYYTIRSYSPIVSAAISDCVAGIGIFDCSLCALNHSALRHVNEAIHRRVTRAAPSCFGRESSWVVPARAKRVSRTFDAPLGGFSFLLSAVPSAAYPLFAPVSLASCFRGTGNFSRENSRHAPPLLQRIFSLARSFAWRSSENHSSHICGTNLLRNIRETWCAVTSI